MLMWDRLGAMKHLEVLIERELWLDELRLDTVVKILSAVEEALDLGDYANDITQWLINEENPDLIGAGSGVLLFGSKSWHDFTQALSDYAEFQNDALLWGDFFDVVVKKTKLRPAVFGQADEPLITD